MEPEIEKIMNYKTWSSKKKIDKLLEMDTAMYTNLGLESTKTARELVRRTSKKIYSAIKRLDWYLGSSLLYAMDVKKDG